MIRDWNILLSYLAEEEEVIENYDLAILAGNSLPYLNDKLVELYQTKKVAKIMITGGVGHATKFLKENMKKEGFEINEVSEAEICQSYLETKYGLSKKELIIETRSRNSGENANFSLEMLNERKIKAQKVLLLQDPILQRRMKATFCKNWQQTKTQFTNYVPILPVVKDINKTIYFEAKRLNNLWDKEYFVSLVLGEISRLRNDEEGYGPKGHQYIEEVLLPEEVEDAYHRLTKVFSSPKNRYYFW